LKNLTYSSLFDHVMMFSIWSLFYDFFKLFYKSFIFFNFILQSKLIGYCFFFVLIDRFFFISMFSRFLLFSLFFFFCYMIQIKPIYLVCLDEKMFATLKYFTGKIIKTCNVAWAPATSLIIYLLMHGFDPTPFQMKKVILVYKPCTMLQVKLTFF